MLKHLYSKAIWQEDTDILDKAIDLQKKLGAEYGYFKQMRKAIQIYERNNKKQKIEQVFNLLNLQDAEDQSLLKKRRFSQSSDENDQIQDILGFDYNQTHK